MAETTPSTVPPPRRGTFKRKRRQNGLAQAPRKCCFCGERRDVHYWKSPTEPVCIICYQKRINVEPCSKCGDIRTVRQRDEYGGAICHKCYQQIRPDEVCAVCKTPGKIVKRFLNGKGECNRCYQRKRRRMQKAAPKPS